MLRHMNVEEEYAIAGRFWLSEITRMTRKGYKVIFIVSTDAVTSRFEVILNQVIFNQNSREPCLIPIMFICDLSDIDEQLKELLQSYVLLHHHDSNLYDRLKLAVCDKCNQGRFDLYSYIQSLYFLYFYSHPVSIDIAMATIVTQ